LSSFILYNFEIEIVLQYIGTLAPGLIK